MLNKAKRLFKQYLNKFGYEVCAYPKVLLCKPELNFQVDLDLLCKTLLYGEDEIFLLQIGAYDGVSNDPVKNLIQRYPIQAILVEPQKRFFEILVDNYSGRSGIYLENVAVAEKDELRDFYSLKGDDLPDWCLQIASFSKENLLKHSQFVALDLEKRLSSEKVKCKTISTLLK
jgi:hypothetical protein